MIRILILFTLLISSSLSSQNDSSLISPTITKISLDKAYENMKIKGAKGLNQEMSIDVQTILIDLIPQIVNMDRTIRYAFDKRSHKINGKNVIYIYNNFIEYIDTNMIDQSIYHIRSVDTPLINKQIELRNDFILKDTQKYYQYTKIYCIENFPYIFKFVDDILKADFISSTIVCKNENKKNVVIWNLRDLDQEVIYNLDLLLPWDTDCFKVYIKEINVINHNVKSNELNKLYRIRDLRLID